MQPRNPFEMLSSKLAQRVASEADHAEYIQQDFDILFDEEPVNLPIFLYDKKFLALPQLSQKQYDFIEAGTQVYYPKTLCALGWDTHTYYTKLVAKWGKGSGKDTVSRIILSRLAYLLLCLKDPQKYLEIMPGDSVNMLNIAYSAKQAQVIFFEPLKRMMEKSLWFKDKINCLEDHINFGKEINLYSGHSEQESMEGHNLLAAVLDEIAAFKTNSELEIRQRRSVRPLEHSAEAVAGMVTSSATSRFPYLHKIVYISYTRFQGDFIEQQYDEALATPDTYVEGLGASIGAYASFGATWDVNPTKTQIMFLQEYAKDPEKAAGRYECKPPMATDAYFKHLTPELIGRVFPVKEEPVMDNDHNLVAKPWFRGIQGIKYFGHCDLGLSKDRAGLCICHRAGFDTIVLVQTREDGTTYEEHVRLPKIQVDLWCSISAPPSGEVDLERFRSFVSNLHDSRNFKLGMFTFDYFQSADMIQFFVKKGILSEVLSVDRDTKAYDTLKDYIYSERLSGYYRELGISELQRLNIVTGNKVDHPLQGSKDEADALAGAVYNAATAEMSDCTLDDIATGHPYEDTFADYHIDQQSGIWDHLVLEGKNEF